MKLTKQTIGLVDNTNPNPTLQEFAIEIIELNYQHGVSPNIIGTKEWLENFHANAKADVDPSISFEECQKVIWNELIKE